MLLYLVIVLVQCYLCLATLSCRATRMSVHRVDSDARYAVLLSQTLDSLGG